MIITGLTGLSFTIAATLEFQIDIDPAQSGWELFKKVVRAKAPPALAPGVMAQLGLLGLAYTFRHPELRRSRRARRTSRRVEMRITRLTLAAAMAALLLTLGGVHAQVGKGIMDFNTATEKDLLTLPSVTPAIVKGLLDKRPFASITEVNTYLLAQGLTAEQATAVYEKAFVHLDLNTCTVEEILLIPRARRMRIEFPEYRPWKTMAQFDKEIGKYVAQTPASSIA